MRSRAWLPPLGAVMIVVAAVLPFTRHAPAPALMMAALLAVATGTAYLLWDRAPGRLPSALYASCLAALIVLYGVSGDAALGFFAAASCAVLRRPWRLHLGLLAAATVALNVVQLWTGSETLLTLLATNAGIMFFASIGWLLVSERQQRERADRLILELEESRRREREAAVHSERARMARELHDLLAHTLSGLTIQLEAARVLAAEAPEPLRERIDTARRLARSGLQEARSAVGALRGEPLSIGSIADLVAEHRLSTRAPVSFEVTGSERPLPAEAAITIYRVVQEALSNVRRHAPAAPCQVRLTWGTEVVTVEITNPAPEPESGTGWGLTGMAERAAAYGADLQAGWASGRFTVRLELPYV